MIEPATALSSRLADTLAITVADAAARSGAAVAPDAMSALSEAVAGALAGDPALRHAVNAEPWYRSRVTWGAIVAAAAPLIGLVVGHEIGVEERSLLVDIAMAGGSIAGAALALHGRWIARVPLGR